MPCVLPPFVDSEAHMPPFHPSIHVSAPVSVRSFSALLACRYTVSDRAVPHVWPRQSQQLGLGRRHHEASCVVCPGRRHASPLVTIMSFTRWGSCVAVQRRSAQAARRAAPRHLLFPARLYAFFVLSFPRRKSAPRFCVSCIACPC